MFSFLKKIDINLYNETETLRKIFQSGENLPYLNQVRKAGEGLIDYLASKNHIKFIKEKTLGSKINNPFISYYLFNVINLKKDEINEFRDVTNDGSHYGDEKKKILEKWDKKRLVEFIYNLAKKIMESIDKSVSIPTFDDKKYNKFVESIETITTQIKEKRKEIKEKQSIIEKLEEDISDYSAKIDNLNSQYKKHQTEILLTESSVQSNSLFQLGAKLINKKNYEDGLRVFTNMHNTNLMDLRAYVGILLCKFKVDSIDRLTLFLIENKVSLYGEDIFIDAQKFLETNDKEFLLKIAQNVETEILYSIIFEYIEKKEYDKIQEIYERLINNGEKPEDFRYKEILEKNNIFNNAKRLVVESEDYLGAIELLEKLGEFRSSNLLIKQYTNEYLKKKEEYNIANAKYNEDGLLISFDGTILLSYSKEHDKLNSDFISIPDTVTRINQISWVFYSCSKNIYIHKGVTQISWGDEYAYRQMWSYPESYFPIFFEGLCPDHFRKHMKNSNKPMYECIVKSDILFEKGIIYVPEKNGYKAVFVNKNLKSISFIKGTTSIGLKAFASCEELKTIVIPNGVETIGQYAFCGCKELAKIELPNSLMSIEDCAFYKCDSLEIVNYNGSINEWCKITFTYYSSNPLSCGAKLFFRNDYNQFEYLTKVKISPDNNKINEFCFLGCSSLEEVTIMSGVNEIGKSSFCGCENLKIINLPNTIDFIRDKAFYNCKSLKNMYIPGSVKYIGEEAFYGCSSLTSIVIPKSIKSIRTNAFVGCHNLEKVLIDDISSWCSINFETSGSNPIQWCSQVYLNNKLIKNLIIPNDVKEIASYAFKDCKTLITVVLPDTLERIGHQTFMGCRSLTSITIPKGVKSIGNDAFCSCSNLEKVLILSELEQFGRDAFYLCSKVSIFCEYSLPNFNYNMNLYHNIKERIYFKGKWKYDADSNPVPLR